MKTSILAPPALAALLGGFAAAQTPTLINGQKVLLDKNGRIMAPAPVVSLPTAPLVGGADSCTTPDPITGVGTFVFDNTTATTGTEGQNEALCLAFGTTGITNDVWFVWTAPSTGSVLMSTCAGATVDTKIAAYAGTTCPVGSALACNDDSCALQSQMSFAVTAGSTYVLQVGNYPGGTPTAGTFTLSAFTPSGTDDCTSPTQLPGPGVYAVDTSAATTSPQQSGSCPNAYKDVWFRYDATTNGSATIMTCGLVSADSVIAVYDGTACPTAGSIGCNDDTCGLQTVVTWTTVCGQSYVIQLGGFGTTTSVVGSFDIAETGTPCGPTGVPFCFGDGTGTACPCANSGAAGNGCASSINSNGANLTTSGNAVIGADTLALIGSGMPNSSALYFQGTSQISVQFGDGLRCVGGAIRRLGTKLNAGGTSQYPTGGDQPVSVKGAVTTPGSARTYQVWYRNAAAFCTANTFNLSNGIAITWQ